jgi:hypothetical protein
MGQAKQTRVPKPSDVCMQVLAKLCEVMMHAWMFMAADTDTTGIRDICVFGASKPSREQQKLDLTHPEHTSASLWNEQHIPNTIDMLQAHH